MSNPPKDREFVTALARGLEVIRSFDSEHSEMTLTEIADRTGVTPATARRALITLETLGYLRLNKRRFVLTPKVLSIGAAYLTAMNLQDIAQPILQDLNETFQDASSLTILQDNNVVYIAHAATIRPRQFRLGVGSRMPANAASTGLVLLANLPQPQLKDYLAQASFPALTAKTPTQAAELRRIFAEIRKLGYAIAIDTVEYGGIAVAVPVRYRDRVVAAVNCSAETSRVNAEQMLQTRLPKLQEAAALIGEALIRYPALAHSIAR